MAHSSSDSSDNADISDSDSDVDQKVEFIRDWSRISNKKKEVVIVTAGKSGAGKSTLINSFLGLEGEETAETRMQPKSVTKEVDSYVKEINGVHVHVFDMPGLHASDHEEDEAAGIIGELSAVTKGNADVLFYCMNLITRVDKVDFENIDTLTKVFGRKIWDHAIFVFTHADFAMLNGSSLEELVGEFIRVIREHLVEKRKLDVKIKSIYSFGSDVVSEDVEINKFDGIVGIPTSKDPAKPPQWRLTLLLQVIRKCKKENIPAFLELHSIDWDEVRKTSLIAVAGGTGGAAVGTVIGASIGAIIGGVLTSPRGGIGAVPTAAVGANVGALLGGVIGAGGGGIASAIGRIAFVIKARHKVEERARRKIKKMIKKDKKKSANSSDNPPQDDPQ